MRDRVIRVALCGAAGRMGREIARAIGHEPGMTLVAAIERPDHPEIGRAFEGVVLDPELRAPLIGCDVVVDFTAPEPAVAHAQLAAQRGVPFVTGTTGLDAGQEGRLREAASRIPVLHAANLSLGMALLTRLVRQAAESLPGYDVEILEMHHREKADAPSGSALRLAEAVESVRPGLRRVHGRSGRPGPRDAAEIGLHALRGGDVVGEHQVIFAGPGERLVLTHLAESRSAFVAGALTAIRFVLGRRPGLYTMSDLRGATSGDAVDPVE